MQAVAIHLPHEMLDRVRRHLLPPNGVCEEAAFLFARARADGRELILDVVDADLIPPEGFASRSRFYLELTDTTKAGLIKRAHDLGAGLVECHSHPGQRGACFSWSDLHGFDDFVPHVMWRLKGRPYAAIVFATDSVDGLAWAKGDIPPVGISNIRTEREVVVPTGLTKGNWSDIYERQPV